LRHDKNQGFTRSKHDCINAASGEIILAIDCDARPTSDFLELCVTVLRDKSIGLLGALVAPPVTDDYTSWYVYTFSFGRAIAPPDDSEFGIAENMAGRAILGEIPELADTEFVGGGIFALRRDVWREVCGFSGYAGTVHEDSYLSDIIKTRGYQLKLIKRPFRLLRVFNRETLCRRYWKLALSTGCVEGIVRSGKSLPFTQKGFLSAVRSRCASIEENGLTLVFYYYEILIISHTLLELCNNIASQGKLLKDAGQALVSGLQRLLAPYPRLWLLLKADLLKQRVLPLPEYPAPDPGNQSDLARHCDWSEVFLLLESLREKNILDYLEQEGVGLILKDDSEVAPDFSWY
jgi:glycosyltransferase involved in cell wall biosynthesis